MTDSQKPPPEDDQDGINRDRESAEGEPGDYYYDDSTGYEIYDADKDDDNS